MSFAPRQTKYDVGYLLKDGSTRWVARGVDMVEAQAYAFGPSKPEGARFVCKRL